MPLGASELVLVSAIASPVLVLILTPIVLVVVLLNRVTDLRKRLERLEQLAATRAP